MASPRTRRSFLGAGAAFLVLSLALVGCGSGGEDELPAIPSDACGVLGLKIFNGTSCAVRPSPVVAIVLTNPDLSQSSCSGVVVGPTTVLTAAHCYCDLDETVCAGTSGNKLGSRVYYANNAESTVISVQIHPQYERITDTRDRRDKLRYDVAILRLSAPAPVTPLPLSESETVAIGETLSTFGYGEDESGISGIPFFSQPPGTFFRLQSGETVVSDKRDSTIESIFTGAGANPCGGDSGGPLILNKNGKLGVVGLTSVGKARRGRACQPGEISIYTDLQDTTVQSFVRQGGAIFQ